MPETIEQLQQKIFPLIQNQQLDTALDIANQACTQDPQSADKLLMLASIYSYKQDLPNLEECCQKALALQPQNINAHYNLAVARQMQGDFVSAEQGYNKVIQLHQKHAGAYAGLAQLRRIQNRFEEALKYQKQALMLNPDNPQFNFQIAVLYKNNNQQDLAIQHYEKALKIMPNHLEALNNLGSLHYSQGQLDQAIHFFNRALQVQPNNAQLHYNLSQSYWQQTKVDLAFQHALRALKLQGDNKIFRQNFIQVLAAIPGIPNEPDVIREIEYSYSIEGIDWHSLLSPSLAILRQDTMFSKLRTAAINGDSNAIYQELNTEKIDILLDTPLLLHCLTHTVVTIEEEEYLFTLLRQACLHLAVARNYDLNEKQMAFMAALACQCFNNEYAFAQSSAELDQLNNLTSALQAIDTSKSLTRLDQVTLILFAMYQPLYSISKLRDCSLNTTSHNSEQWKLMIERHLTHAQEEQKIMNEIVSLTPIDDQTSQAVRDQYEASPYPRWLSINLNQPRDFRQVLMEQFPHFQPPESSTPTLDLLIAGCGTGSHVIMSSTRFSNVKVLAIDLSRHSLAYAQRMAIRNKIKNLQFAQADILSLKDLGRQFHIIESIGVLHHMKKPEEGLKVLRNLLHKDGMINLGFYSTIARRYITQARVHFKNTNPTTENIRRARQEIFALPKDDPIRKITEISDFYSLSDCRDLIFHTQEHCYTIPEIKDMIQNCGLRFIGFEFPQPSIKKRYMEIYPEDTHLDNLDNWTKFEEKYPDTFICMYTFWCQRID